jgi:predicted regulator of Ras-like GTPase activity (Roadblock/LC7/MglB family)
MLRASKLPEVLGAGLQDGIYGAVLMTSDGSVICSKFLNDSNLSETALAAISSSVWANYSTGEMTVPFLYYILLGASDVNMVIEKLSEGLLGVATTNRGYVIALCGNREATVGMIRSRLLAMANYFSRVFDQLK